MNNDSLNQFAGSFKLVRVQQDEPLCKDAFVCADTLTRRIHVQCGCGLEIATHATYIGLPWTSVITSEWHSRAVPTLSRFFL